jgi:hypothetical protein
LADDAVNYKPNASHQNTTEQNVAYNDAEKSEQKKNTGIANRIPHYATSGTVQVNLCTWPGDTVPISLGAPFSIKYTPTLSLLISAKNGG